jgi:hypothetical protein
MNVRLLLLTPALAIGMTGCWFGKKVAVAPQPLPPQPAAANPAPPPQAPPAGLAEALPIIQPAPLPSPEATKIEATPEIQPVPPKKRPAQAKKRPAPPAASPDPEQAPAIIPPSQPTNPPAKLAEVLTDDRRRQYESDFTRSTARARVTLSQTTGRNLTAAQKQTVERIRTFLQQAEQAKSGDLATAVQLARRADLLAQDLRKSLQ